jgi:hypothetical protein
MRELKPKKLYEQAKYHNRLLKKERGMKQSLAARLLLLSNLY